jgi:hypothetical protein
VTLHVETPPGDCICPRCSAEARLAEMDVIVARGLASADDIRAAEAWETPLPYDPECGCAWCRQWEADERVKPLPSLADYLASPWRRFRSWLAGWPARTNALWGARRKNVRHMAAMEAARHGE